MNLRQETRFIMDKYGINANKSLGQNFLIDENIIEGIVDSSAVCENDLIIEIGPGLGSLTKKLLEKAGKVICIELDKRMIKILQDRFSLYNNFEIIEADVLKTDIKKLIENNVDGKKLKQAKIVANLPYYITTPIIMKLLEEKLNLSSITVMVQKEVADRLTAIPGEKECGAITYTIYYYTNSNIVKNVPKTCFVPVPEVDSSVIKLDRLKKTRVNVNNEKLFFEIIKAGFMQKRKTFINAIMNKKYLNSKQEATEMLNSLNIDEKIRGERITIENYVRITDYIERHGNNV